MSGRDVLITGIGLVSSLGEGAGEHWRLMSREGAVPVLDSERFAPYTVHPLLEIDWSAQIAKRGDQRQMDIWQRLGTYAAGLALDDAGIKGDEALCSSMDMIVAAGGGERDVEVDTAILEESLADPDHGLLLNRKLTTELRPTLFLAQLSNLLAGNISIVHKVTGSSRTFMGEEGSGIAAVETAAARIRAGQSDHVLVGGSYNAEHPDMLLGFELSGYLHRGPWKPVWRRRASDGGGVVTGSGGAFLVLESREHAERRGRGAYAALGPIASSQVRRGGDNLASSIANIVGRLDPPSGPLMVVSGASGAHGATEAEQRVLLSRPETIPRAFASLTGHLKEAQFPFALALAAIALREGGAYPPFAALEEPAFEGRPRAVLATTIGCHRGEGAAMVLPAE